MTRAAALLTLLLLPAQALAHGGHIAIAAPLHLLSHWGHLVGLIIVVGALVAFFRQRDEQ